MVSNFYKTVKFSQHNLYSFLGFPDVLNSFLKCMHYGSLLVLWGSMGFSKCMSCIFHSSVIQRNITAQNLWAFPNLSPLPCIFFFFTMFTVLAFSECHIIREDSIFLNICLLFWGAGKKLTREEPKTFVFTSKNLESGFLLEFLFLYLVLCVFFFLFICVYYLQSVSNYGWQ